MADIDLLRSTTAIVARRTIAGDYGGATVHCVVLADGFIIECGYDGYSEKRAVLLAQAVNAFGSEQFDFPRYRDGGEHDLMQMLKDMGD